MNRCREIWEHRYPSEPFENEADTNSDDQPVFPQDLLDEVSKHRYLYNKFSEPYSSDMAYLIASKQRYKGFIYMMQRFSNKCSHLVPTSDVLLMWLTHQVCLLSSLISKLSCFESTGLFFKIKT